MTATINASTSSGLITTADTSGVLQFQSNGTAAAGVSSSNFQMNSGYGSVATAYGCRAWVCFNGSGTVAIRASGNVTSVTDLNTGRFTVNFTTAMPDSNYCMNFNFSSPDSSTNEPKESSDTVRTSSAVSITSLVAGSYYDSIYNSVSIHR